MNFRKRIRSAVLMVIMLCSLSVESVVAGETSGKEDKVTILFTHDIHSRLDEYKVQDTGDDGEEETAYAGGFARLKTIMDERRTENPATFVFDAGDFSMSLIIGRKVCRICFTVRFGMPGRMRLLVFRSS